MHLPLCFSPDTDLSLLLEPPKCSPFPSAYYTLAAAAKLLQSCPTLCDPIDGSPPGSPVPGILQARILSQIIYHALRSPRLITLKYHLHHQMGRNLQPWPYQVLARMENNHTHPWLVGMRFSISVREKVQHHLKVWICTHLWPNNSTPRYIS